MKGKKTFSLTFAFRNANGRLYTRPPGGWGLRFRNSSAGWRWKKRVERMMNGQTNEKPAAGTAGQGKATNAGVRHTYFSTSGKPVASLCGRTLQKRVRGSLHQLRRPPAWAVDAAILEAARRDGATRVEITDIEGRKVYTAAIADFDLHGFVFNRGHGDQVGLALCYWQVETQDARQLMLFGV